MRPPDGSEVFDHLLSCTGFPTEPLPEVEQLSMICVRVLVPSLMLFGLLLPSCANEPGSPLSSSSKRPSGEAPTVANTPAPDYGKYAKLNEGLPRRGETLPAIVGTTLDGTSVSNATLTGKTALINLWFYH